MPSAQSTHGYFSPLSCIFHVLVKSPLQGASTRHVLQTRCCSSNHVKTVVPTKQTGVQNKESCRDTRLLMEQLASWRKCCRQRVTHDVSWGLCLLRGISETATVKKKKKSELFVEKREMCGICFLTWLFTLPNQQVIRSHADLRIRKCCEKNEGEAQSVCAHTAFRVSAKWMLMQLALVLFFCPEEQQIFK